MNPRHGLLALALMLAGCVTVGTKVEQSQIAALHRGETTYDQVVSALGPPTAVTTMDDGRRIAIYSYTQAQARPESFVPLVGPFIGGADATSSMVSLTFDTNGVLQTVSTTQAQTSVHH